MAEICCEVVSDSEPAVSYEPSSRAARRRRMEIRKFRFVAGDELDNSENQKRPKLDGQIKDGETCRSNSALFSRNCRNAALSTIADGLLDQNDAVEMDRGVESEAMESELTVCSETPRFGYASVCGRRRDMEDAVDNKPSFSRESSEPESDLHYFGVFDGHGCSHVAMRCRERMHAVLKAEIESRPDPTSPIDWRALMERSFARMDKEVIELNKTLLRSDCRCELRTPECDAVGSTAVVAVVSRDKIIVANCGDSRAVLCRGGKAVALSSDHKPDRPDELHRIESAGGRVIYWDGPRVLGVLAMSRAIGDNYLKPYVICEPEITITDRAPEDECLILASDGLWDVVSNGTACGVAKMCLSGKGLPESPWAEGGEGDDKACADTSMLLTKLALARHSTDNVSVVVVDLRRS
uniref:protein-serine/threonine phosphatase n=1 Tax=Kalanchoe fedtschenkoi TaxID=63787 RepID=A0A7N0U3A4_KALFE